MCVCVDGSCREITPVSEERTTAKITVTNKANRRINKYLNTLWICKIPTHTHLKNWTKCKGIDVQGKFT